MAEAGISTLLEGKTANCCLLLGVVCCQIHPRTPSCVEGTSRPETLEMAGGKNSTALLQPHGSSLLLWGFPVFHPQTRK